MSQISRNGQIYSEPTLQVFKKDNSGTFEKYQQLRIGDYEFKKFCFLKEDLLNGELEMRENQPQFDKNIGMEHVLEQCHKVREISIGLAFETADSMLLSSNTSRTTQLQLMYKFDFFVERRTTSSNK